MHCSPNAAVSHPVVTGVREHWPSPGSTTAGKCPSSRGNAPPTACQLVQGTPPVVVLGPGPAQRSRNRDHWELGAGVAAGPVTLSQAVEGQDHQRHPDQHEADPAARPASARRSSRTPIRNCSTGVRYCSRPRVDSGTRRAAPAKNSSGTAVTIPALASSSACPGRSGRTGRRRGRPARPGRPAPARTARRSRRSGTPPRRRRADLLLQQAVAAEGERQHQRDPRRPAVVDGQHDHRERCRARAPPTAPAAAARAGRARRSAR